MDWLLRLQDAPRDPETARRFEAWRARSPDNDRAWVKACDTWRLMGEVPPVHAYLWRAGGADRGQRPRNGGRIAAAPRRRRWGRKTWRTWGAAGGAVAAALAVFLAIAAPGITLRVQADYVTPTAESRIIALSDGSVVTLGADSAIAARLEHDVRRVRLLSGEAFFEVAPDAARPFIVASGGVDVTVLGTAFNVRLSRASTTVELARGSVGVGWEQAGGHDDAVLSPGEMIVVDRQTGEMMRSTVSRDDIAAWRGGRFFVNDATIASVVEQLQRYHTAWISVPDRRLAQQRVTGLYDLRDPDRALRALVQPYDGRVRSISPYIRVVSGF